MRIRNNISALNAFHSFASANDQLAKTFKRLSTGLRVNSAADDAAGLAISEKLRAQIRGTDQATENALDGISLLQTADGALNEIHSLLQRMRELSVQAANGTLTSDDRSYIQLEIDQLISQANDIADQTKFNGKSLLNGESAVLWSTSTRDLGVIVSGTLLSRDRFGQRVNAEGNYKITFHTTKVGTENVQKSNIFSLKHGTSEKDLVITMDPDGMPLSGLTNVRALNMVEGEWRIETRERPFGGVRYYHADRLITVDPAATVGGALTATPSPRIVSPGEYDVRLSDRVPMMATFNTDRNTADFDAVRGINVSSWGTTTRDFDSAFTTAVNQTGSGSTEIKRMNGHNVALGNTNTGDVTMATDPDTDANVYIHTAVSNVDLRDVSSGDINIYEDYVTASDATIDIGLKYRSKAGDAATATLTYATGAAEAISYTSTFRTASAQSFTVTVNGQTRTVNVPAGADASGIVDALNAALAADDITATKTTTAGRSSIMITNDSASTAQFSSGGNGTLVGYLGLSGRTINPGGGQRESTLIDDGRPGQTGMIPAGSSLADVRGALSQTLLSSDVTVGPVAADQNARVSFSLTSTLQLGGGYTSIKFGDTEITRELGLNGKSTSTTALPTAELYNGFQKTGIDTEGRDLAGIAAALQAGVGEAGFTMGATSSQDHSDTLIGNNSSKYSIELSGDTITELNGGAYTIARGAANATMQNKVWNGATFKVDVPSMNMREIATAMDNALRVALNGDQLTGNNGVAGVFTFPDDQTVQQNNNIDRITLMNSDETGYDISVSGGAAAEMWTGGASAQRGYNKAQSSAKQFNNLVQTLQAGRTMEQLMADINDGGTQLKADWTDADHTPSYDGSHHEGQITLTNNSADNTGAARRAYRVVDTGTDGTGNNARTRLFAGTETLIAGATSRPSNIWQARDSIDLSVNWNGTRSDGTLIAGGRTVTVWEGDDGAVNAGRISAATNAIGQNFFTNFYIKDNVNVRAGAQDFSVGDSWMTFTQAKVIANATNITVSTGADGLGNETATYSFAQGALENKNIKIGQMLWTGPGVNGFEKRLDHDIEFGSTIETQPTNFRYGERVGAGDYGEWALDNGERGAADDVRAWYSHSYFGDNTTYWFHNATDPSQIVTSAVVNRQNTMNASILFSFDGTGLKARVKGFTDDYATVLDGDVETPVMLDPTGLVTIQGIEFTDLRINTDMLTPGDKFVINVAAAAKLGTANTAGAAGAFTSTANIAITGDPFQQGAEHTGSSAQYRLTQDTENGKRLNLLGFFVSPINGSNNTAGVGYYDGNFVLDASTQGFNPNSTVGLPDDAASPGSYRIHAEVNYQGDTRYSAGALVTSGFFQKMELHPEMVISNFVQGISYSDYKFGFRADGSYGWLNDADEQKYSDMNGSLIFDVVEVEPQVLTFRIQGHFIDRNGVEHYAEEESRKLFAGRNTDKDPSANLPDPNVGDGEPHQPVLLFADSAFGGVYLDELKFGDISQWTAGDRFTVTLTASGFRDGIAMEPQLDPTDPDYSAIDEINIFSDNRGSTMPHSFRFNDGVLDGSTVDLRIYQMANNIVKEDSPNFYKDQVMDGTLSLSFADEYHPKDEDGTVAHAATFTAQYGRGNDYGVAHYYSNVEDVAQFWDKNGRYILENGTETLTIKQGGNETELNIQSAWELGEMGSAMSTAIWNDVLKQYQHGPYGPGDMYDPDADKLHLLREEDKDKLVQFINTAPGKSSNESVVGTMLARSVLSGESSALEFYGSEDLLRAFAFTSIQQGSDTEFRANVNDAHSGAALTSNTKVVAGTTSYDLMMDGIAIAVDVDLGLRRATFDELNGTFSLDVADTFSHVVHLADNALVLQTGANEMEDVTLVLGDMRTEALGIKDLSVRSIESAARAITMLDRAIGIVSSQRATIGAQINRLEHTVSNLIQSSMHLTESRSRIVDADIAREMMTSTKLTIVTQAGTSMLAQANQLGNNVMALLR